MTIDRDCLNPTTIGSLLYDPENLELEWYQEIKSDLNYDEAAYMIIQINDIGNGDGG